MSCLPKYVELCFHPVSNASAAVCCDDIIYIMNGFDKSVYMCFLQETHALENCCKIGEVCSIEQPSPILQQFSSALPPSTKDSCVWKQITDIPVHNATCVSLDDQLLAVNWWEYLITNEDYYSYSQV